MAHGDHKQNSVPGSLMMWVPIPPMQPMEYYGPPPMSRFMPHLTTAVEYLHVSEQQRCHHLARPEHPQLLANPRSQQQNLGTICHRNQFGHAAAVPPINPTIQYAAESPQAASVIGAAATAEVPIMISAAQKSGSKVAQYFSCRWPTTKSDSPATRKKHINLVATRAAILLEASLRAELQKARSSRAWGHTHFADVMASLDMATYLHTLSLAIRMIPSLLHHRFKKDKANITLATYALTEKLMPRFRNMKQHTTPASPSESVDSLPNSTPPHSPVEATPSSGL